MHAFLSKRKLLLLIFLTLIIFVELMIPIQSAQLELSGGNLVSKPAQKAYLADEKTGVAYKPDSNGCLNAEPTELGSGALTSTASSFYDAFAGTTTINAELDQGAGCVKATNIKYNRGISSQVIAWSGNMYTEQPVEPVTVQAQNAVTEFTTRTGIVNETYAQESTVYFPGLGYDVLKPIQSFYNVNRNVAYILLIAIVMVDALLILFRRQFNSQALTVLNSLPSIILSLALITFSYAISGFFVDLITIGTNAVQYVLVQAPGAPGYNTLWNGTAIIYNDKGMPVLVNTAVETAADIAARLGYPAVPEDNPLNGRTGIQADDPLMSVWLVFGTADLQINQEDVLATNLLPDESVIQGTPIIGGVVNSLTQLPDSVNGGEVTAGLGSIIMSLVLTLALFMASIRIFFKLLSAYLTLVLFPAIAPYLFLMAALPTMTSQMIMAFVRPMLSSSLKFIVTYAIFLTIVVISYEPLLQGVAYVPPLLGYDSGRSATTSGHLVRVLIAYGLFLSTPVILDSIGQLMQSGGAGPFGEAIGMGTKTSAAQLYGGVAKMFQGFNKSRYPDR